MLRSVQCIGWSCLDATPIRFQGPGVIALLGQNGSGKSSMLDAIKSLCGARRFGQGRSASSYRFAGRGGAAPLERAYVLGVFEHQGRLPRRPPLVTVCMEVTASRRRFAVLEGTRLLDPAADLDAQLQQLLEPLSPGQWMRPGQYQERVLDPLGIGPALRRLLELPQGEIARALDKDPEQLLELLVELAGGSAATERFQSAREAVVGARRGQAEARRRLDRGRAELAEARLDVEAGRRDDELRERLAALGAQAAQISARHQRPPSPAPRPALNPRRLGLELVLADGVWCVPEAQAETAAGKLGPGESLPIAERLDPESIVRGPAATEAGEPAPEPGGPSPRQLRELAVHLERLEAAGIEISEGGEEADPGELIGALAALSSAGVPEAADPADSQRVSELERRVSADQAELERRGDILDQAAARLGEAEAVYQRAVLAVLSDTARRFAELCDQADLVGKMQIAERQGAASEVQIFAAEERGEELRPLHGAQASLSGGWRASVVTLAVLACLSSDGAPPILLLDEVAASLDEERLAVLGRAFARLGSESGLTTIITVPSKNVSQTVASFANQQIAFFRPRPDEALAPPPHIVVSARSKLAAA